MPDAISPDQTVTSFINIAFCFDAAYVPHMAAAAKSAIRTSSRPIRFFLLHDGMPTAQKERFERNIGANARYEWFDLSEFSLPDLGPEAILKHTTAATFMRLYIPEVVPPDVKRILYLDADLIVLSDLGPLFDSSLHNNSIGAVMDVTPLEEPFQQKWDLPPEEHGYFNAGVLLLDIDKLRNTRSFERALAFAHTHSLGYGDQDALNYILWNAWTPLDPKWNVQRQAAINPELVPEIRMPNNRKTCIVHYTSDQKPWLNHGWHPWSWCYWENLRKSGYAGDVFRSGKVGRLKMWMDWLRWIKKNRPAPVIG